MPIFEYVCKVCDHRFEILLRGASKAACPSCNSSKLERQLSVFAAGKGAPKSNGFQHRELPVSPCGTCGDPRGQGSCSMN